MSRRSLIEGVTMVGLAVLGVWLGFFTQWFESWLRDSTVNFEMPWFVAVYLALFSLYQGGITFKAFISGTVEQVRMEKTGDTENSK